MNPERIALTNDEIPKGASPVRKYVFTCYDMAFNPVLAGRVDANVAYLVFQKEICPSTNREHYQGYVQLHKPMRYMAVKRALGAEMWLAMQKGTNDEAREYCVKDESRVEGPWEYGVFAGCAGSRRDLSGPCMDIRNNKASMKEIATEYSVQYVKYHKGLEKLWEMVNDSKRNWKTEVYLYWGPPGTGKSWHAQYTMCDDNAFIKSDGGKWWDGYSNDEDVILEDFEPADWNRAFLLNLLDRYPLRVEVKGGFKNFVARRIFITTNSDPVNWVTPAIARRITKIEYFGHKYNPDIFDVMWGLDL